MANNLRGRNSSVSMEKKSSKVNLMSLPTGLHPHLLAMVNPCSLITLTSANKCFYGLKEVELRQIVRKAQNWRSKLSWIISWNKTSEDCAQCH